MRSSHKPHSAFTFRRTFKRLFLLIVAASTVGFSVAATANETSSDTPTASTAELTLLMPAAATGIWLKLHGVEDLRATSSQRSPLGENRMDELKKQEQKRYLAKKLNTDDASARTLIDLA